MLIREAQNDQPEENPWGIKFSRMFDMSNDSHLFRTREHLESNDWQLEGNIFCKSGELYLPLYEAKMVDFFDHRAADIRISVNALQRKAQPVRIAEAEKIRPERSAMPLFWISQSDWQTTLLNGYNCNWMLGFGSVTSPTNERTFCPVLIPKSCASNSLPLILTTADPKKQGCLLANTSAYVFDYIARQKVGGVNLNFFLVKQFPVHPPEIYAQPCLWSGGMLTLEDWLLPRVLELTYTTSDMQAFANACGYNGPPFLWNEERRFLLRCELDAAFFHLYLGSPIEWQKKSNDLNKVFPSPLHAIDHIMETFPIVKRKDVAKFNGDYRTKRVILELYNDFSESIRTGKPYQTRLNPPLDNTQVTHQARSNQHDRMPLRTVTAA